MAYRRLSLQDWSWLVLESRNTPMHIGVLFEFTPPPDARGGYLADQVARMRRATSISSPWNLRLARPPAIGPRIPLMCEERAIDLDYHVRHSALPSPGGQRELDALVSRLHGHPLDLRRPLWELHMIEGLEGDRFALYLKIHHAVIDGTSGIAAFMRAFSSDPGDRDTPALWEAGDGTDSAPDPRPRRRRQSVTAARALARDIAEAGRVAADLRRTASYGGPLMAPYQTAVCDLRCTVLGQRRLTTQRLDLPAAKAVAKACGVTLNDVVLYVCATAVRRYLHRHGTLPDRPLTAGVPVNLRDASDRTMGTKIGMMVVDLATNVAGDRERLAAIARSTAAAKHHQQSLPRAVRDNYTTLMHLPYVAALAAGLRGRAPAPFNMVVSNTPGPPTPLYMNGSRMDALYPISLLMHGNALNFTCVSYAGEFNFGIIGGRDEVRHLQDLALYLQQAFRELSDSALAPSRAA